MPLNLTQHTTTFATSPQLQPEDLLSVAQAGFKTVINNRPDGEGGADQPTSDRIALAAKAVGLTYHHLPVISGQMTPDQIQAFAKLLENSQAPILAFCRSGTRSTNLWKMASDQA